VIMKTTPSSRTKIRFGDNDTLAALVTNLVEPTAYHPHRQQGLYTDDPQRNPQASLIRAHQSGEPRLEELAGGPAHDRKGGDAHQVLAAKRAARSGRNGDRLGNEPDVLVRLAREAIGTLLSAQTTPLPRASSGSPTTSRLPDACGSTRGARALRSGGKSLLPVGVRAMEGEFERRRSGRLPLAGGRRDRAWTGHYNAQESRRIAAGRQARSRPYSAYRRGGIDPPR